MTSLLTIAEAGAVLRCRDPRTARKRLVALGVPTIPVGRSCLVSAADLDRALRVAATVQLPGGNVRPAGVVLPPGARLWDSPPDMKEARRRANVPGRGDRVRGPAAAQGYRGTPGTGTVAPSSVSLDREEVG